MSNKTVSVRVRRFVSAEPARVFDVWLDPQAIRVWMRAALQAIGLPGEIRRVEVDPVEGGRFRFCDVRDGAHAEHFGTYLTIDRPHTLAFTWFSSKEGERNGVSKVTVTIAPAGGGSDVTLVHEMPHHWADHARCTRQVWDNMQAHMGRWLSEPPASELDAGVLRLERRLPGPVELVFSFLTDSEKRRRWLAAGPMELVAGGKVEHLFRHRELSHEATPPEYREFDSSPPMFGEVTRCEPPRLLAYTWPGDSGSSEVTFELFPDGDEVRLVLTHRRLPRALRANVATGWHTHLGLLRDRLEGRPPRGFWSAFHTLEPYYRETLGRS